MNFDSLKVFFLLKSALQDSEEKGKYLQYLDMANYFGFKTEISFFSNKVKSLEDSITTSCNLIRDEFLSKGDKNEKAD